MAEKISEQQKKDFHEMLKDAYQITNFDISIGVDSTGQHVAIASFNRGLVFEDKINISSINFPAVVSQIVTLFTKGESIEAMILSMAVIDMYQDVIENYKLLTAGGKS